jgi:hypothetical protein
VKQVSQADRWCVLAFKADSRGLAVSGVEMCAVRGCAHLRAWSHRVTLQASCGGAQQVGRGLGRFANQRQPE